MLWLISVWHGEVIVVRGDVLGLVHKHGVCLYIQEKLQFEVYVGCQMLLQFTWSNMTCGCWQWHYIVLHLIVIMKMLF